MTKQLLGVCLGIVLVSAGCLRSYEPVAGGPVEPLPAQSFARQWEVSLPLREPGQILYYDVVPNRPTMVSVLEDRVVVYDRKGDAYGIDRQSGQLQTIHHVAPEETDLKPPVAMGEQLVYPMDAGLRVFTEGSRHSPVVDLDWPISSPAVRVDNRVIFGINPRGQSRLVALSLRDGWHEVAWEVVTAGNVMGRPAIHEGIVYFGTDAGRLYATEVAGGAQAFGLEGGSFQAGPIVSDIQADEQGVYFASMDSKLYSIDRHTGKINWIYFSGAPLSSGPVVREDRIYQHVPGRGVVAINKTEGKYHRETDWEVAGAEQYLSEDEKYVYLRAGDNSVVAADKKTGDVVFRTERSDFVVFGTNLKDALIYAATADGKVIAIKPVVRGGVVGQMVLVPASPAVENG